MNKCHDVIRAMSWLLAGFLSAAAIKVFDKQFKEDRRGSKPEIGRHICGDPQITQCRSVLAIATAVAVLPGTKESVKALIGRVAEVL